VQDKDLLPGIEDENIFVVAAGAVAAVLEEFAAVLRVAEIVGLGRVLAQLGLLGRCIGLVVV
jgi:hypothetical protein